MHLIAAHSRFCAIEKAREAGLKASEWGFVTDEWFLRGRTRLAEREGTTDRLIRADCWRPNEHEQAAVAALLLAGVPARRTHCGVAR